MNLDSIFNGLQDNWWLSRHILFATKSLPEKLSCVRRSDLLRRFSLLMRRLRFCSLHLNLTVAASFFFKRWHAWRLSDFTSWSVRGHHHQLRQEQGLCPVILRWYWALLTAFLSNWAILSVNNWLLFLITDSSEKRISSDIKKLL